MKKLIPVAAAAVWVIPALALAQTDDVFSLARLIRQIIDGVLVPLVFAVAFLLFIWGIVQYFIANGGEEKEKGKSLIIWGVVAFAVMVGVWGLVNILLGTFDLNQNIPNLPTTPGPR